MTHKTGSRPRIIQRLTKAFWQAIDDIGATMSETKEVMHEIDMAMHRAAMEPWEDQTCPTCPMDDWPPYKKARPMGKPKR